MNVAFSFRAALICAVATIPAGAAMAAKSSKAALAQGVTIPAPPAGKGQVVFFRPSAMGMAIRCTIRENGHMIGRVGNGKYMIITAEPGAHKYTTKTEATDELNLEVEPDETTYVKCKIAAGIMAGRPNISPATKADFDAKSAKLDMQDMSKLAGQIAEDEAELAAAPAPKK